MNEAEAETLFGLLRAGLPQYARADEADVGFPKAIEQEIAAGKQVRVQLSVMSELRVEDPLAGGRTTSSRSRAQFVQQHDFTPSEKVAIVLEGIELARIAPARMADEIIKQLCRLSPGREPVLRLTNDEADTFVREISGEDVAAALPATRNLALAIDAIREELAPDASLHSDIL